MLEQAGVGRRPTANDRSPRHFLIALVALGVLLSPVEYRGGADRAHPHAFVQLWFDAAQGSLDHHPPTDPEAVPTVAERPIVVQSGRPDAPWATDARALQSRATALATVIALGATLLFVRAPVGEGASRVFRGICLPPDPPHPRLAAAPL